MFAPVATMKSQLLFVAVVTLAVSQLAGCFTVTGGIVGSRFESDEVTHSRQKDGRIVAGKGDHALAGMVIGVVLDAALIGAVIAVDHAASSWTIGPICTDDRCY
jgi:hypothetical protein